MRDETVTTRRTEEADSRCERGRTLVLALQRACQDSGSPVVPAPVAEAIRALVEWANEPDTDRGTGQALRELQEVLEIIAYPDPMTTRRELVAMAREALGPTGER